jgi:hypothetical protein
MTHEEAKAWLTERNVFPRVTPVAEPGMWYLRTRPRTTRSLPTAEPAKSLSSELSHPHQNVQVGPTAPATFASASVPRSRKAARKKTRRTKSPKTSSARILCLRRVQETICRSNTPTAEGWRGFLIAVQFDGREVFLVEPTEAREFRASDWTEVPSTLPPLSEGKSGGLICHARRGHHSAS